MVEVKPVEVDLESLVSRVFLKSIDLLGGFKKLAHYRTLTWLPSLARASYAVVLREEYLKTEEEIAQEVGLTKQTVRNILRADPTLALEKLKRVEELTKEEKNALKVHTAGGIAKLAYKMVREGHEEPSVFLDYCRTVAFALDVPWAYAVLRKIKGTDFPIKGPEAILEKLKGLKIKGYESEEVLRGLHYPIKNPAQLLHEIKEFLKLREG